MKQFQLAKKEGAASKVQPQERAELLSYQDREFLSWKKQIARQLSIDMGCTRVAADYLSNTQFAMVAWRSGLSVGEAADTLYEANRDLCDSLATNECREIVRNTHLDQELLRMILGNEDIQLNQ